MDLKAAGHGAVPFATSFIGGGTRQRHQPVDDGVSAPVRQEGVDFAIFLHIGSPR
jgi:hypothetical protein